MVWPLDAGWPQKPANDIDGETFDYIIVGGGTAGCVVASRLSEDPSVSVLLISRGPLKDDWLFRSPLAGQALQENAPDATVLHSEADERWTGKPIHAFTSSAVGGATNVNGLMLTRGAPGNYNLWEQMGNDEWSWEKCEPWFKKIEDASACFPGAAHRGQKGPLKVTQIPSPFQADKFFEKAARKLGLPVRDDANDPNAPAMGMFAIDQMVYPQGHRLNALKAYLPSSVAEERRGRLTLCNQAIASKIVLDKDGAAATGVQLINAGSGSKQGTHQQFTVRARREVVLCCGALFSPQVLMLSGIGPKAELEAHEIPVVRNLPGVGQNLSDHVSFGIAVEVLPADSYIQLTKPLTAISQFAQWALFKTGIMSIPTTRLALWVHSAAIDDETMSVDTGAAANGGKYTDASRADSIPDIELMFTAASFDKEFDSNRGYSGSLVTMTQPYSRGRIALASSDPLALPKMHHPLLTDERDLKVARKAARFATHLLEQSREESYPHAMPWHRAPGLEPGSTQGSWADVSDEEVDAFIQERLTGTLHATSTCRMAREAEGGVVGQDLRVHGVKNLRIADASVFPAITSAHTVAPTFMVAERCADLIKRDWSGP